MVISGFIFSVLENIAISVFVALVVAFLAFLLTMAIKGDASSPLHLVCFGLLAVFVSFPVYGFLGIYDAKNNLEESNLYIQNVVSDALDFIDEIDKEGHRQGIYTRKTRDVLNDPMVQKGLKVLGIHIGEGESISVQEFERLNAYYNKSMWKKAGWIVFFFVVFVGVGCVLPDGGQKRSGRASSYKKNFDDF